MKGQRKPNSLVNENSPYLLQHANNPVHWMPWSQETLDKAKEEDKLLLISIGYAACHWCHVMAHETFEDDSAAAVMNKYFICIKVDREERPDIDQVYMEAVQMMTGSGGWPLHCFALPDGRPFYGGTYFPLSRWMSLCKAIATEFQTNRQKLEDYASQLHRQMIAPYPFLLDETQMPFDIERLKRMVGQWKNSFDPINGGENRAPKFPMPVNLDFLLAYGHLFNDEEISSHVLLTLRRMAKGGIYDQIGGGFARYSTDKIWKVPHFEKMLYDNAQLVSLYSHAFQATPAIEFRQIAEETIGFITRELLSPEGVFYSSLDADSEGVEGKYYIWELAELEKILGRRFPIAQDLYNLNANGYWENGFYILHQTVDLPTIAENFKLPVNDFLEGVQEIRRVLFNERNKRTRPQLDDKTLTSWNGLMIKALANASAIFQVDEYSRHAENAMNFILEKLRMAHGGLYHTYRNGKASVPGFLEDYAFIIEALFAIYQIRFDEKWLTVSKSLLEYCLDHFLDESSSFFFFTSNDHMEKMHRKIEVIDGVIPSANSSIARSLFTHSRLLDHPEWEAISLNMLGKMEEQIVGNSGTFSNWASLLLNHLLPFHEIAVTGSDAFKATQKIKSLFLPNTILAASSTTSQLPILSGRETEESLKIYICRNKVCGMPVTTIEEALSAIKH